MQGKVTSAGHAEPARRSTNVGLVPFLFGVAQVEELPGLALVRLLGDLGIGTNAARTQLARMRRDGQLATSRHGREARYRLAGPFAATFHRLRRGERPSAPPAWEGHFHALLYQVPEPERAYRDRLRRIAQLAGYGILQQGVLIAVRDLTAQLAGVLAEAPRDCRVQPATLALPTVDAAGIARTAWGLDAVATTFHGHVAMLERALDVDEAPPATAATLVRLARLLNAPYVDLIRDPGLPEVLLPDGWPRPRLDTVMGQVRERYLPAAASYVRSVIGTG